jgi:hypothetical protein
MAKDQSRLGGEGRGQPSRPRKTFFRRFSNIRWYFFIHRYKWCCRFHFLEKYLTMAKDQSTLGGEGWGQLSRPKKISFRHSWSIRQYFFHPPPQVTPRVSFFRKTLDNGDKSINARRRRVGTTVTPKENIF